MIIQELFCIEIERLDESLINSCISIYRMWTNLDVYKMSVRIVNKCHAFMKNVCLFSRFLQKCEYFLVGQFGKEEKNRSLNILQMWSLS